MLVSFFQLLYVLGFFFRGMGDGFVLDSFGIVAVDGFCNGAPTCKSICKSDQSTVSTLALG